MSGDVQPRKRKEKRKKKEEVPEDLGSNISLDETIHVQKDEGTGGNFCAKIVFFSLMGVLLVLIGLILTEYRGSSDLDNPILESRWAPIFAGWVDDAKHDHDDHAEAAHSDEHEEGDHEEDEHGEEAHEEEHEEEEHEVDEHSEEGDEDEEEESPPGQSEEDQEEADDNELDEGDDDEEPGGKISQDDDADDDEEEEEEDDDAGGDDDDEEEIPGVTESVEEDEETGKDQPGDEQNEEEGEDEESGEGDDNELEEDDVNESKENEVGPEDNEEAENDDNADDIDDNEDGEEEEEDEDEPESTGAPEESNEEEEEKPSVVKKPATQGGQAQEYQRSEFANEGDWRIRNELEAAEADLEEKPEAALKQFLSILAKNPNSPRGLYGKAKALDRVAEMKRSNFILDQAIEAYENVLKLGSSAPDKLFLIAAEQCITRMRFRGLHLRAVPVHKSLILRFPHDPSYLNQLAVTYLLMNRVSEAKRVLEDVLQRWPLNGFAQVHYGFILKTSDNNMVAAVDYLQKGIATREPGTLDGRFFFQLGDALLRLGQRQEAMKVNELAVKEGLFLSKYQRSLYNVDRLRAQPWWTPEETTYASHFKKLVSNWQVIQTEGLRALYNTSKNTYKDEEENLKDFGQWKQLKLFARGRKVEANCVHAPVTCRLIEAFPAARDCKRGQVKFSVMYAGTHVWPHCGPTNCRLRAHLGLVVPPGTFIRVMEETRSWEQGKLFIFDDSFEHEVWHNGTTTRLVLIVDVWHPDLTEEEMRTLSAI